VTLLSTTTPAAQIVSYWPSFFWHFHFSLSHFPSALGSLDGDVKGHIGSGWRRDRDGQLVAVHEG
jgi:hypothetical protein